ncbi:MAG: XdhC family protein [Gammaproteobacteria bacterium]|nr:XdhC family protein [Gammaproteobacteria bacterium]
MKGFWSLLAAELARGLPAFLVLVVAHGRGSPGTVGARMFVCADGHQVGTIGGSVLEFGLLRRAQTLLAAAPNAGDAPHLERFIHRRSDPDLVAPGESGLICSGWQQHVSVVLRPERDLKAIRDIADCDALGGDGAVWITEAGVRFVAAESDLTRPAVELQTARGWRVVEQLLNRQRVAIFGGGHCGLALSRVMTDLDWHVTVIDHRTSAAAFRDNSSADQHTLVEDFESGAGSLAWPQLTDAVVMTTDYSNDVRAVLGCLDRPLRSIGVMGSPAKLRRIREVLAAAGVNPAGMARIRGPVGLHMKSDTPAEIAVSIAAELLQFAEH